MANGHQRLALRWLTPAVVVGSMLLLAGLGLWNLVVHFWRLLGESELRIRMLSLACAVARHHRRHPPRLTIPRVESYNPRSA